MLKAIYYLRSLLLVFVLFSGSVAMAEVSFPDKPSEKHFYIDQAQLLNHESADELDRIAGNLLKDKRVPLYVVTIPSLASYRASAYSIEQYAAMLFDHWGIGSVKLNYGMLLLVSKGDRKARIEFGQAWDHRYDNEATDIMQSLIIPAFKNEDYSLGILQGVRGLDAVARGLDIPSPELPPWFILAIIALGVAIIAIFVSLYRSGKKGWAWAFLAFVVLLIFMFFQQSSKNSKGSRSGFGGGRSGGGGATGSW